MPNDNSSEMTAKHLISIIVPSFNQSYYLPEALDCLISQTYEHWECIIINDGSTDNTEEIALKYCKADNRFQYHRKRNGGLSSARNAGLKMAKGYYIQFLDSDDFLEKTKFETSLSHDRKGTFYDIFITNFQICDNDLSNREPPYCDLASVDLSYRNLLLEWDKLYTIPIHCGLFKATLFEGFTFNEKLKAKEDWLMWLHIFKKKPSHYFINKPLAIYRFHETSMSKDELFMNMNTNDIFEYIMKENIEDKYKLDFFTKINNYWLDQFKISYSKNEQLSREIVDLNKLTQKILKSSSYKMGNFIINPLSFIKNIYSFLKSKV